MKKRLDLRHKTNLKLETRHELLLSSFTTALSPAVPSASLVPPLEPAMAARGWRPMEALKRKAEKGRSEFIYLSICRGKLCALPAEGWKQNQKLETRNPYVDSTSI
jgi:hypothetical protein